MDVAISLVGAVVVEIGRALCGSAFSNLRNATKLHSNLESLRIEINYLSELRNDVNQEVDLAEKEGKVAKIQVKEWLQEAEECIKKANPLLATITPYHRRCFLHCSLQWQFIQELAETVHDAETLKKGSNFLGSVAFLNYPAKAVEYIPVSKIEDHTTASQSLSRAIQLLEDGVPRIGIWGMGGVGKTTLMKNLNNRLQSGFSEQVQPFGIVIWVTVSKKLDQRRTQTQIAERLKMEVKMEETVESMAARLYQRLLKEEKFLLIVDDVWEAIDFDSLGVPQPEVHTGCRIILSSRSLEVCREMKTDEQLKIEVLIDTEAWDLFKESAGDVVMLDQVKPLAESVARECGGLPLALVTVGTAMRGKIKVELWEDALSQLRKSVPNVKGVENKVYASLKWSYDSLQGTDIKPCFLYCCLYPEDHSIETTELVHSWMMEGLIDDEDDYDRSLNRGIAMIEYLKNSCLLESGSREGTVKMNDVVRDVSIWIASSEVESDCMSLIRSIQIPVKILSSLKRISWMNNSVAELPDCTTVHCPKVTTLLLQGNHLLERIPEKFLQGFVSLRVLNLSGTRIRSLPPPLQVMSELRALMLKDCICLELLPSMDALTKLHLLDLSGTNITQLPEGIEDLRNLRILDLSRTMYLKNIPSGTVSKLSSLEVLHMQQSSYTLMVESSEEQNQVTFTELVKCMKKMVEISIKLESTPFQDNEALEWLKRLKRFEFFIGASTYSGYQSEEHDSKRMIFSGLHLPTRKVGWLLINVSSLVLHNFPDLAWLSKDLAASAIERNQYIRSLTVVSCGSINIGGGSKGHNDRQNNQGIWSNLEEIRLHYLSQLYSIIDLYDQMTLQFSALKSIEVIQCPNLTYLFPESLLDDLRNLESIKVSFCDNLVELILAENSARISSTQIMPNLLTLELQNLPKLKRVQMPCPHLENMHVKNCFQLSRRTFSTKEGHNVQEVMRMLGGR